MKVVINGESRDVAEGASVQDMLAQFNLEKKILVVEHNRVIVDRSAYEATVLQENDRIEIVHFVGGG